MDWNTKENKDLIEAVLAIENQDEAKRFLRDLMTEGEIQELSKRLKAAKMLTDEIPYLVIEKETGLSSTTIARVAKWLNGQGGGYKKILNKIHHTPSQ